MDQRPTTTFGRLRSEQRKLLYSHFGFVKNVFLFFQVVIYAFMFMWIGGVIWLFGLALREMLSARQPLVINGERSTWAASIGFVALVLGMGFFGVASMVLGLRLFRKNIVALHEVRKKQIEK